MSLEAATTINQLVITNPDGNDPKGQGDDHIRLIKSTLKNTFPNVTGVVTATHTDLNKVGPGGSLCPPGIIVAWSGAIGAIPAGWALCNGVGSTTVGPVPNLIGRFLVGTDGSGPIPVGSIGGSTDIAVVGATQGTALTEAQIPSHRHFALSNPGADYSGGAKLCVPINKGNPVSRTPGFAGGYPGGTSNKAVNYEDLDGAAGIPFISNTGGGAAHAHNMAFNLPGANLPPFYRVAYIIKI